MIEDGLFDRWLLAAGDYLARTRNFNGTVRLIFQPAEEIMAGYIAGLVRSWGYDVAEGVGQHGIVASLTAGSGTKAIGLRADTDALPIQRKSVV